MATQLKPLDTNENAQATTVQLEPVLSAEEQQSLATVDGFSTGPLQPFEIAPEGYAPLSTSQLEGVATTLSGVSDRNVTLEDVRKSFNEGLFGTTADEAIKSALLASDARKEQAMLSLLNRGDLTVQQRVGLIRKLNKEQHGPDMNAVERSQLSSLNVQENGGYTPEAEEAFQKSLDLVSNMPVLAQPATEVPALSKEELQRSFEVMLNQYVVDANEASKLTTVKGAASFLPNLLPFFGTTAVTKVVKEINKAVGTGDGTAAEAALLPGTAIRQMRERIEGMPLEEKIKSLAAVMRVLKGNKAIFPTQNSHIQAYLVHSLFYKDIEGTDYIKQATDKENKAFIHARQQAEFFGRHAANEQDPAKRTAYAQQKLAWERKAIEIDQNASGRMWHEYDAPSFGQWLDDLAILDWMVVGPLLRGTIKGGTKALTGSDRRALQIAPDATTGKYIQMLQDPRVRKKMTELLGEDIAETMLPAATKNAVEEGVEGMGEMLERAERLRMEINRTLREGSNVTAQSRDAYRKELEGVFGNLAPEVAKMHTTQSAFTIAEDGVEVLARYGATPTKPFSKYSQAEKALDNLPIEGRIVEKTDKGFVPASPSGGKFGRYFIEVTDKRTYDSSRTAWESALFDRAQVRAPWFLPVNSAIGGKAAKTWNWFYSSSDMFGPKIFNQITSDVMRGAVVQKLHTGFVRTMLSLPRKEQAAVSSLLKQGEEIPTATGKGTVFTTQQIRTMYPGISDKAVTSYYEARTLADNMWELANTQKRAEYFREGVKSIHSSSGHVGYGRLLNSADDAVEDIKSAQGYKTLHVFYPETGDFAALTRGDIDNLYRGDAQLVRMEELIQGKNWKEATHVVVNRSGNNVRELPRNVLEKINGYYPHIYQANYVVYGVTKAGNKVAVATARSISDATKEAQRIKDTMANLRKRGKDAPFESVDYQFDRALRDPMIYKDDVGGPVFGASQKVYGTRNGVGLRNASKAYGDHMVDPIEALLRGMELVSHSVTKGSLIKNMEARLYNTLRLMENETGQRIIKDPRKLVKSPEDLNYVSAASKDMQKAVAYMQQIDMVRHIPDAVETHLASLMVGATELFYQLSKKLPLPGLEKLEGALATRAAKGVDPMRLLTEMAHRVYIAGNPIQQFALQLSQASLVLGIAPRDLPRAFSAGVPMQMLVNARIMFNSGDTAFNSAYKMLLPIASKAIGMKPETLDKMVGVLERSGLVDTVSVHSQIRTTARAAATSRMLASASTANQGAITRNVVEALRKLDDSTFGKLSQYGFEAGEQMNRIITFLSLYRRDVRKGIANLDKPEYIQKLVGEVNTLVGSMLRETSMGYQRGWLKAAFQFVAFQHKMASMMLFSKNLSFQQKLGISLSQFLLFGTRGAAHMDAFHRALETVVVNHEAASPEEKSSVVEAFWHPTTQSAIDGLVFDMGVNSLIRAVGGSDEPGFAWNRRLAPGGGSEMVVDTLIELRNNPVEKVFGLSGKHGSKLVKFFDKTRRYMLAQAQDMDDVPAEERWKTLAKEGATLAFSGYDKYLQAAVMKEMGGPVTATGNVSMSANTTLERTLAAALGVASEDRQAFLEATDKYYFDVRNTPKRHKEALDEIADQMYRELVTEMVKLKGQAATPEAYEAMETRLLQNKAMMLSFLTPHEAEVVSESIGNKIAEAIENRNSGTSAEAAFVADLTQDLMDGKLGDKESLEWEAYMRHTPLFQNHPELMGDFREARRQMLTYEGEEE